MPVSDPIELDVFFDYLCPYVYRMALLLAAVAESGVSIRPRWRYFSLTQVNSKDEGWTAWGAPADERVKGRLAFHAAEAARRQGRFDDVHKRLLDARHRDRLDLDRREVIEAVAAEAGLDLDRFRRDLDDTSLLAALERDHREGAAQGVFGTPTLVFPGGAAYVRLADVVEAAHAPDVFRRIEAVAASEPRILEIKRPLKPVAG